MDYLKPKFSVVVGGDVYAKEHERIFQKPRRPAEQLLLPFSPEDLKRINPKDTKNES